MTGTGRDPVSAVRLPVELTANVDAASRAVGEGESKMKLGPRPKGQPWTPAEDAQLLALLDSKMDRA